MSPLTSDSLWILVAAAVVLLLPLGQLLLELAVARKPTARTAPARVAADLVTAVLLTWLVGYSWVHGPSLAGFVGLTPGPVLIDGPEVDWRSALATWHGLAVAAAVVIAGSAGTERARPICSLVTALLVAGLLMPTAGHWIWGGRPDGVMVGWLGRMGYLDHGGAVVVHVTAGAAGLALAAALGPRRGRYDSAGRPRPEPSRRPELGILGALLSVGGCLGLVAASRAGWTDEIPGGLLVSLLGAAAGVAGAALGSFTLGQRPDLRAGRIGAVAGVVSTAAAPLLGGSLWALGAGLVGGLLAVVADHTVLRTGIDDPVGVVPCHLVAGVWGACAAALAVAAPGLPLRLMVQLIGALAVAVVSASIVHTVLLLVDRWIPLRVSPFSEDFGSGLRAGVMPPWEVEISGVHAGVGVDDRR